MPPLPVLLDAPEPPPKELETPEDEPLPEADETAATEDAVPLDPDADADADAAEDGAEEEEVLAVDEDAVEPDDDDDDETALDEAFPVELLDDDDGASVPHTPLRQLCCRLQSASLLHVAVQPSPLAVVPSGQVS